MMGYIIIFALILAGVLAIILILKRRDLWGIKAPLSENIKPVNLPGRDISAYVTREPVDDGNSQETEEVLHVNIESHVEYPTDERRPRDIPGKELEEEALSKIDFKIRDFYADVHNRAITGRSNLFDAAIADLSVLYLLEEIDDETFKEEVEKISNCGDDLKKLLSYHIDNIIKRYVEKGADEKYIRDNLP